MITERKSANAVGGATARACDSCLRRRARWYCPADDAFLCQGCDSSVHSANQLASRHERVRLETASNKGSNESGFWGSFTTTTTTTTTTTPSWHQGFTRKARTPRHHSKPTTNSQKNDEKFANPLPLVPEIGSEEGSLDSNDEQLLYRVPVFDPFDAELYNEEGENEISIEIIKEKGPETAMESDDQFRALFDENGASELDNLHGFLASDMDLNNFAADVESLLGIGMEDECCGIEGLGLLDCKEENEMVDVFVEGGRVKVEDEETMEAVVASQVDPAMDGARETFDWNFEYESPVTGEEEDEEKVMSGDGNNSNSYVDVNRECIKEEEEEEKGIRRRKIFLRLNYEEVITAWGSKGSSSSSSSSPWTNGIKPELNPDLCSLDFMGTCCMGVNDHHHHHHHHMYGCEGGRGGGGGSGGDGRGREARVLRYREKRRTRLFSKKIRYEVRKLNAEKRPRMKGRFVKRTSSSSSSPPSSFGVGGGGTSGLDHHFPNYNLIINK